MRRILLLLIMYGSYLLGAGTESSSLLQKNYDHECPICFYPLEGANTSKCVLKCGSQDSADHIFHRTCLKEWVKKKSECPTCRRVITSADLDDECDCCTALLGMLRKLCA